MKTAGQRRLKYERTEKIYYAHNTHTKHKHNTQSVSIQTSVITPIQPNIQLTALLLHLIVRTCSVQSAIQDYGVIFVYKKYLQNMHIYTLSYVDAIYNDIAIFMLIYFQLRANCSVIPAATLLHISISCNVALSAYFRAIEGNVPSHPIQFPIHPFHISFYLPISSPPPDLPLY